MKKIRKGAEMNNTLMSLNNFLFEQLERINNDSLTDEQLEKTIKKAEVINKTAENIIKNNETALRAVNIASEYGYIVPATIKTVLGIQEEPKRIGGGEMHTTKCNDKIMQFIKEHYKGKTNFELTEMINKTFNKNLKVSSIKRYKNLEHLKSGIDTKYKTKYKIGGERDFMGYTLVKVKHPNVWKNKGYVEWEKAYGKIPKGYNIIYLDGNKKNADLSNLACVSNVELGGLRKFGKCPNNPELRKAQVLITKIGNAIKERGKR